MFISRRYFKSVAAKGLRRDKGLSLVERGVNWREGAERELGEQNGGGTRSVLFAKLVGRRKTRRLGKRFGKTRVGREVERFDAVERFRYFSPREPVRQDVDRAEKGRIAAIDDSRVRNFRR